MMNDSLQSQSGRPLETRKMLPFPASILLWARTRPDSLKLVFFLLCGFLGTAFIFILLPKPRLQPLAPSPVIGSVPDSNMSPEPLGLRDEFVESVGQEQSLVGTSSDESLPSQVELGEDPPVSVPSLKLDGIIFDESGRSVVLINGRIVAEGSTVNGALVQKIFSDRVEVRFRNRKKILKAQ